eukprot:COSAG06_NODE_2105_length_7546_cov_10.050575_6_plen_216_part_00
MADASQHKKNLQHNIGAPARRRQHRYCSKGTHATHAFVAAFSPFATSPALFKKQPPAPALELWKVLAAHDGVLLHSAQHATGSAAGCCGARAPSFQSMLCLNLQVFQCFGTLSIDRPATKNGSASTVSVSSAGSACQLAESCQLAWQYIMLCDGGCSRKHPHVWFSLTVVRVLGMARASALASAAVVAPAGREATSQRDPHADSTSADPPRPPWR